MSERHGWQPSQRLVFFTTTALSVAGIVLQHHSAILGALESYYAAALPFLQMLLGIVAGYSLCRWRLSRDVDDACERVEGANARMSSIEKELEKRPTREEVDDRVAGVLREFAAGLAEGLDDLSKTSDDRLRERIGSGEVSGFEARVLGEVLGLDAHPRRWLRSALEEGYVDVEDRVVGGYDRLGHFRNLVTAAETGLPG